ncbi:N-6 DNA Methylase family protein [Mycobacterium ulcerans str. Harvey]|uniref:N-6 DNA Methylase family protein n=1 Tax=Mycobacterium ulcerans str. Harvey TaxID=1299332 RepID=A0ABN0R9C3_MYCUL|nr:N-6 DNA Methylase family protein [Mycobacterium ulcerans str. Harvey]
MWLHGNEDAEIAKGDTITSPQFTKGAALRTFDFAVANPPFSVKSWNTASRTTTAVLSTARTGQER